MRFNNFKALTNSRKVHAKAMMTYLESLLSENATAGPGAHKMDLCDCAALELQEAFDSDKEYRPKLGSISSLPPIKYRLKKYISMNDILNAYTIVIIVLLLEY